MIVGVSEAVKVSVAVGVGWGTCRHAENSDVLPALSVAVAVMNCPVVTLPATVTLIAASPLPLVDAAAEPRKVAPSPLPDALHAGTEKNSNVNVPPAVLLNVP